MIDEPLLPPEAQIAQLVDRFYEKVRADEILGPIFAAAIEDWGPHLATMRDFWSSVMRTSGRYKGNPFSAHLKHPIRPEHFQRWLALFAETTDEVVGGAIAGRFRAKAENIARSLQMGLFFRPDAA